MWKEQKICLSCACIQDAGISWRYSVGWHVIRCDINVRNLRGRNMIDMQCIVWNTWGPIESGAQFAFDWSESTVAMFANWGTILFLLSVIPLSKMIEVKYKKCSGDASSTTDIRMLWSAMVCFDKL